MESGSPQDDGLLVDPVRAEVIHVPTEGESGPAALLPESVEPERSPSPMAVALRHPAARVGLVVIAALVVFSYIGPLIWSASPNDTDLLVILQPPSSVHPFGTDDVGRDVLARMMVGGQVSLNIGVAAAALGCAIGVVYGAISGFAGGRLDSVMMRFVDGMLAIPVLVLLIVLAAAFRPNQLLLILVISLTSWLIPARLIRAGTLSMKSQDFIKASQAMGSTSTRTLRRHVLPNSVGIIVVNATFQVADAILLVAYLSFLGLGIPPPTATWGGIMSTGISYINEQAWWLIYFPGLAILLAVVAFNYLGDTVRDAYDVTAR
ncbi:MAG: ABC transporter permease [Actinobacteria bacterium]|nr:ABC transporter permease [Actinomycetota bacterium]